MGVKKAIRQQAGADKRHEAYTGVIRGLMKALEKLAPHPSRPNHTGPLFIKNDPQYKKVDEQDGMLGAVLLENFLGPVFTECATNSFGDWARDFQLDRFAESASEYLKDRNEDQSGKGKGSFALCENRVLSNHFNVVSIRQQMMEAFLRDLPRRREIETALSYYTEKLNRLDNTAQPCAFAL